MEQAFRRQREDEANAKRAEKERIEKERFETLKQKEVQRITEERRRTEKQLDQNNVNGNSEKTPIFSSPMIGGIKQSPQHHHHHQQPIAVAINTTTTINNQQQHLSPAEPLKVQKSNSVANIFGDRLRRGSEPASSVKRAESMKVGPKQPKRTPSFTTRRRAQSFRKNQPGGDDLNLPPIEIQGMLERKHELQSGGKKAPVRSWKVFHTVLCGQLLCFFKDEEDFFQKKAATAPVSILNAVCEKAENYTKKKNVFRLRLPDGSEFLFLTASKSDMVDWVNKLSFHAALPPNLQLLSYDESMKVRLFFHINYFKLHFFSPILQQQTGSSPDKLNNTPPQGIEQMETSPISSRTSSPDSQRRSSRHDSIGSSMSGGSMNTPQINFLQKQRELREQSPQSSVTTPTSPQSPQPPPAPASGTQFYTPDKPPIPPRGVPPPVPQRQSSHENMTVTLRSRNYSGSGESQ